MIHDMKLLERLLFLSFIAAAIGFVVKKASGSQHDEWDHRHDAYGHDHASHEHGPHDTNP